MKSMLKNRYRMQSIGVLLLIALYLFLSVILTHNFRLTNRFYNFFTGPPSISIKSNLIQFEVKKPVKYIELRLDREVEYELFKLTGTSRHFKLSSPNKSNWIRLESKTENPMTDIISIKTYNSNMTAVFNPYFIEEIILDNDNSYSIPEIFYNIFNFDSNASLYYPFKIENLSSTLAKWSEWPLYSLIVFLMLIFLTQLAYILTLNKLPNELANTVLNDIVKEGLSLMDKMADQYAVPLGFLGTLMSLWITLENAGSDLYDFKFFVETLKIALLTSVLGLSSKLLLILRAQICKLIK